MSVARFIADQRTYYRVPHAFSCRVLDPAPVLREAAWTVDLADRDRSAHRQPLYVSERIEVTSTTRCVVKVVQDR